MRLRSSLTCDSSLGRSGSCAARSRSFAAWLRGLEPRRLLTRALAFLSEQRRERYWSAASKSESSSFSLHFSFDLLTSCLLPFFAPPPGVQLNPSGDAATLAFRASALARRLSPERRHRSHNSVTAGDAGCLRVRNETACLG